MSYVGQVTTYLALLFVGLNVSLEGKRWFSKPILGVATVRLLALPMALFGLMKCLGLKEVWTEVIIIHSGMPPAVNNIILADYFGLDKKLMATIVTETTALALLALPLLICLVEIL
jgi:predicted permease